MKTNRPHRIVLLIYEFTRLYLLLAVFIVLRPVGEKPFPWLVLITPGAMFLLMALFWYLDVSRYRLFCPLYLAGKGLSVITAVFWLFFEKTGMIRGLLNDNTALLVLILGDLISIWVAVRFMKDKE